MVKDDPSIDLAVTQEVADVIEAIDAVIERSSNVSNGRVGRPRLTPVLKSNPFADVNLHDWAVIDCALATDIEEVTFGWLTVATDDSGGIMVVTDVEDAIFLLKMKMDKFFLLVDKLG